MASLIELELGKTVNKELSEETKLLLIAAYNSNNDTDFSEDDVVFKVRPCVFTERSFTDLYNGVIRSFPRESERNDSTYFVGKLSGQLPQDNSANGRYLSCHLQNYSQWNDGFMTSSFTHGFPLNDENVIFNWLRDLKAATDNKTIRFVFSGYKVTIDFE